MFCLENVPIPKNNNMNNSIYEMYLSEHFTKKNKNYQSCNRRVDGNEKIVGGITFKTKIAMAMLLH